MKAKKKIVTIICLATTLLSCGKGQSYSAEKKDVSQLDFKKMEKKMKVEVWSDIVCPYCYIGKTRFEKVLEDFPHKNEVEVVSRSYQLMPDAVTRTDKSIHEIVSETRNIGMEQVKTMHSQLTRAAKEVGLEYNFDKVVFANTFKAHQLIHFAAGFGKQKEAEKLLFRSYFTDGKNIDDMATLIELGAALGLNTGTLKTALENGEYIKNVEADISEARDIGVRGVPFFVFNRKYAISGAQDTETFLETLEESFSEWRKENPKTSLEVVEGKVCNLDGECG